ncbi:MAG: HupE/UreJ family protein [Acetobacteraceae bacterium]|nr:HupE/UreJ family protein [Acetobacteraceae bacterium]
MTTGVRASLSRFALAAVTLLIIVAAHPTSTYAHQFDLTTARIVVNADQSVDVQVAMKGGDAERAVHRHIVDGATGLVRGDSLADAAATIGAYVNANAIILTEDGQPCEPGRPAVTPDDDGVQVHVRWSCASQTGKLRYRDTILLDVSPTARQVVLTGSGTNVTQDLLDARHTEIRLSEAAQPSLLGVVELYIRAGIEHIFLGYDHIAFLIAVVLWARRLWPIVKVVTAFTIAHSITLSLAALDIVRIPSAIIEPAIAASIIYVALENFLSRRVDKRWRDTFAFGLIHGFGFASALQEFGLPKDALVLALGSFNLGVEIGQVAIVSLILPVLLGFDRVLAPGEASRTAPFRRAIAVYPISAAITVLATFWFLSRTGVTT